MKQQEQLRQKADAINEEIEKDIAAREQNEEADTIVREVLLSVSELEREASELENLELSKFAEVAFQRIKYCLLRIREDLAEAANTYRHGQLSMEIKKTLSDSY